MEQRPPFLLAALGVASDQLQHGILHDVQRGMLVAYGKLRLFIGASLGLGEEIGKLLRRGQFW